MAKRKDISAEKNREVIHRTEEYVRSALCDDSSGHDWWHVVRVRNLAVMINDSEEETADPYIVELSALLHDISDYKFNGGDLKKGARVAFDWLLSVGESQGVAANVAEIIDTMSFKGAGVRSVMSTAEGKAVQDADRLDAMGAIGIARAFAYGGYKRERMYDADITPNLHCSQNEYLSRNGTTINHFYEKLLLLKDRMNTASGRAFAEKRHVILENFLENFFNEWNARDL